MAPSVLGKRTRSSVAADSKSSPVSTRSQQRVPFVIASDDENENPFVGPKKQKRAHYGDGMDVDDAVLEIKSSKKRRTPATAPAEHGLPESRVALSPIKINELFKTSKAAANVAAANAKPTPPSTPRHRDALRQKVAVTPRHRVGIVGKPLTPRSPHTPSTPRTTALSVYNEARQIFTRSTNPGQLTGRDSERNELQTFISSRSEKKKSGCLYISGPPGTGKSAMVNQVASTLSTSTKSAYINCMSVKNATDIYSSLLESFGDASECVKGDEVKAISKLFKARECSYLVTLDEIDHLLDIDMDLLYTLFELSLHPRTSLILLGVANALDFTDRFLPRLKSRGLKPELLPFMPYNAAQIGNVITQKLKALLPEGTSAPDYVPFLHPTAVMFLSKKVASQTGDLRKAFDLCRRVIDLIETETRTKLSQTAQEITPDPSPTKTPLVENMNLSSPKASRTPQKSVVGVNPLQHLTVETAPRATIAHMSRITASIFNQGANQRFTSLNLQQKAVLCALAALETRNKNRMASFATPSKKDNGAPTVKQLYDTYASLCKQENTLHPLTATEFRDVVGSLETLSLVASLEGKAGSLNASVTPSRRGRGQALASAAEDKRVASVISRKELESALTGAGGDLLFGILEGDM